MPWLKVVRRGLDADVYRSQIYCLTLVLSTCGFVKSSPPCLDDGVWARTFRKMCKDTS